MKKATARFLLIVPMLLTLGGRVLHKTTPTNPSKSLPPFQWAQGLMPIPGRSPLNSAKSWGNPPLLRIVQEPPA